MGWRLTLSEAIKYLGYQLPASCPRLVFLQCCPPPHQCMISVVQSPPLFYLSLVIQSTSAAPQILLSPHEHNGVVCKDVRNYMEVNTFRTAGPCATLDLCKLTVVSTTMTSSSLSTHHHPRRQPGPLPTASQPTSPSLSNSLNVNMKAIKTIKLASSLPLRIKERSCSLTTWRS